MADARSLVFDKSKLLRMTGLYLAGAVLSGLAGWYTWPAAKAGQILAIVIFAACLIGVIGSFALITVAFRRMKGEQRLASFDEDGLMVMTVRGPQHFAWSDLMTIKFDPSPPRLILAKVGEKERHYPLMGAPGDAASIQQWYLAMLKEWTPNKARAKRLATVTKNLGH